MTNIQLNPQAEITDDPVYNSHFLWRPEVVKTLDYEKIKQQYDFSGTHLFILCGVSTAGKDTLLHEVLKTTEDITLVPRATSRVPRTGEVDGVHYFFGIEDCLLWSTYAENIYGVPSKILPILSEKKKVITSNGIVYAPTMKDIFERLGVTVTILYIIPGKLTDSLEDLQKVVMERLSLRDAQDERAKSISNELQQVMQHKDYLEKLETVFIENEQNPLGYSKEAIHKLQVVLSSPSDIL